MNLYAPFTQNQVNFLQRSLTSWFNVAEGGKRGGKNVLNTLSWCIDLETHPDRLHLAAGVSIASAKLNILDCDGYGLTNYFEDRCRQGEYKNRDCLYIDTQTGQKIVLISGGAKQNDQKYIKGNTYGTAYITEANECNPDFVYEVFDRTISSSNRKVRHDLNPKSPIHWYYKDILDFHERQQKLNPNYGYNWGKFTLLDNLSIDDVKLKQVLSTYDKGTVRYEKDILGNRKQTQGLIYTRFANNPDKYLITDIPRFIEINVGLDFGGSQSANALVASGITYNHDKLIALASERHFNNDYEKYKDGIMPSDVDEFTVKFVEKVIRKYGRCDYLYWDNESTTLGNGVKRALGKAFPQVTVKHCYKAEIKDRFDLTQRLIGENRFGYTSDCQTLVDAMCNAMYDPKIDDRRLDDGSTDVDSLDAFEYGWNGQIKRFIK